MKDRNQIWKLLFLGVPVLILVLAGIALTAMLSVDLVLLGLRNHEVGPLILGTLLATLWAFMFYKTAKARLSPPQAG